jgi:hypothetical protein
MDWRIESVWSVACRSDIGVHLKGYRHLEQGTSFSLRQFCCGYMNYLQVVKSAREQKVSIALGHTVEGKRAGNKRLPL